MHKHFLALFFLVAACSSQDEPVAAAPVAATPAASAIDDTGLRARLAARHAEDLPDKAFLARHARAAHSLHGLAWNDDRLLVRRRAAAALGLLAADDKVAEGYLVELLAAPEVGTRAGALQGLGELDLSARADLRALVEAQAFAEETQVAYAAVAALAKAPEARPVLARVAASPAVDARVRELATVKLGGAPAARPRALAVPQKR